MVWQKKKEKTFASCPINTKIWDHPVKLFVGSFQTKESTSSLTTYLQPDMGMATDIGGLRRRLDQFIKGLSKAFSHDGQMEPLCAGAVYLRTTIVGGQD